MISKDVVLGNNVSIPQPDLVNLYGCSIGDGSRVGAFVEVQRGAAIGTNCKISSHTFVCNGVTIEDGVFVGHGVMFINDVHPRAVNADGSLQTEADWTVANTRICARASLGSNCTIMGGIRVGAGALVGAGAVVTRDVPDFAIVAGVPARVIGDTRSCGGAA
jgi:acetyltransferase-like isoleucine patch superfamily enzyme